MKRVEKAFVSRRYQVLEKSNKCGLFGEFYLFKHPNRDIYVFVICDDGKEIRFYLNTDSSKFEFYFDYPLDCFNEDVINRNFEGDLFDRIIHNRFGV